MIIKHRMRYKHQNADSLSKKTKFCERLEQKQANQAEIKEGFSFLDNETYEELPLTRWLDKSGHPIPRHPELPVEKAAEIKIYPRRTRCPWIVCCAQTWQELSRMNINMMRMLGGLLEREVTRDNREWATAMASFTVSEKVKIMPSKRQHKEIERDRRTKVQQLVSSIPQDVLTSTSYKRKEQRNGTKKKTVTFEEQDKEGEEVERRLEQGNLSGETNGEERGRVQDQHPGQIRGV